MYNLVFHRANQPVLRHELKGDLISIGRDPSSDIQLLEGDISRTHAVIVWNSGGYSIIDKSTNGTLVNGNLIESHRLQPDDIVKIGDWNITFKANTDEQARKTIIKDISPTKVLKYEAKKKELLTETMELTAVPPQGSKKTYTVKNASIGTADSNDIVISTDPYLSSRHCQIKSTDEGFVLEDINSTNGTFIDDRKIKTAVLSKKCEFTAGRTLFRVQIKQHSEKIKPTKVTSLGEIIGGSNTMREIFSLIEKIAASDAAICVVGESGTGKELIARYIHEASDRGTKPFVALNCGAIPANLIESELFGHEKGSFTSATSQHNGVFEQANSGTLFLDEIGEMPPELQTRLLRVLETREIRRVGGQEDVPVNVRIITATNRDLKKLVSDELFREDLFYRLYVVPVEIPPLRERKEDIPLLVKHFAKNFSVDDKPKAFSKEALKSLCEYNWPGNVRELKNAVQRAILVSTEPQISEKDIIFSSVRKEKEPDDGVIKSLEEQERDSILKLLKITNGNASETARKLGVSRTTLNSMIKKWGINIEDMRK